MSFNVAQAGFHVLTEFKFEIGEALLHSKALQGEIDRIGSAAEAAEAKISELGMGIMAHFGIGYLTVASVMLKAFTASEKFYQSQLKISNVLLSNRMFSGPNSFENSMAASADAMERMQKVAREFSLPATSMTELSTSIGAALMVKGLDDSSMSRSIDLSRAFLKSAPVLLPGQDPSMYQSQLIGAISGRAELGGTLVQRLLDETEVMKPFSKRGGLMKFNLLKPAERLDKLTKALDQFSSQTEVTKGIAHSFTGQMQKLQDNLFSMFSIFRKLGNSINKPMTQILSTINQWLETKGEKVANNFGKLLDKIFRDPLETYYSLKQVQSLKKDTNSASKVLGWVALVQGIAFGAGLLTKHVTKLRNFAPAASVLEKITSKIAEFFMPTGRILGPMAVGAGVGTVIIRLTKFVGVFAASLLSLTFVFQIVSRAMAKARIDNMKWIANNIDRISALFVRLQNALAAIFAPITMAVDALSDMLAWVFNMELSGNATLWLMDRLIFMLEVLGKVIVGVLSAISSAMGSVLSLLEMVMGYDRPNSLKGFKDKFIGDISDSWNLIWKRFYPDDPTMNGKEKPVSKQNIEIGKVEINNVFKEMMQPDRIAFTLRDQLLKAANNPKSANGRSFTSGALAQ
jgi:hypothetical protein